MYMYLLTVSVTMLPLVNQPPNQDAKISMDFVQDLRTSCTQVHAASPNDAVLLEATSRKQSCLAPQRSFPLLQKQQFSVVGFFQGQQ